MWASFDGTLVMYVQYDDSLVSELKFPRISEAIGGTGAARSGFLLPTLNNTMPTIFPDHITIRYPTVKTVYQFYVHNNQRSYTDTCCSVSARQLDTKSKVMDSRRTELDVPAEMGSQTSEHFRWNVSTI